MAKIVDLEENRKKEKEEKIVATGIRKMVPWRMLETMEID